MGGAQGRGRQDRSQPRALTGDDLIDYVNRELFPYLEGFKGRASSPDTIEYKIGEIFGEIRNKFTSGYSLRDALDLMDRLSFRSQDQKHELSELYEAKIKNMGNAGRNGGEYYTPRPLIRAMIRVLKPRIGEKIYDGAARRGWSIPSRRRSSRGAPPSSPPMPGATASPRRTSPIREHR